MRRPFLLLEHYVKVQVIKPFTLTLQDGTQQQFAVGVQDVPDVVAEHWYTKLHLAAEAVVEKVEGEIKDLVDGAADKVKAEANAAEQAAASAVSRRKQAAAPEPAPAASAPKADAK